MAVNIIYFNCRELPLILWKEIDQPGHFIKSPPRFLVLHLLLLLLSSISKVFLQFPTQSSHTMELTYNP